VAIEGKLRYSTWESNGQKRSKLEVVVDDIEFMNSRQGGQDGGYAQAAPRYAAAPAPQAPVATPAPSDVMPPDASVYTTDIPF
jgi:single-strand DNA-binding protein